MSYEKKVFYDIFNISVLIHDVIKLENEYKHELEDIFTKENIDFLIDSYLYDEIKQCFSSEPMTSRSKKIRNQIQCWWEGVDDKLYHKRLDQGENI